LGGERAGVVLSLERDFATIINDLGISETISYLKIETKVMDKNNTIHNL
jgi:hypothetical protein